MKRYWLFEFDQYYPGGGMYDFKGDFDTIEEADAARSERFDVNVDPEIIRRSESSKTWTGHQILDTKERCIVKGWNPYSKVKIENTQVKSFK